MSDENASSVERVNSDTVDEDALDGDVVQGDSGEQVQVVIERAVRKFSGPLPHPELFEHYDRVHPGAAERILRMTEKSLDHKIAMEAADSVDRSALVEAGIRTSNRAQIFTFVIVVFFLALTAFAISRGQQLSGVATGLMAIGAIAWALRGAPKDKVDSTKDEVDLSEA